MEALMRVVDREPGNRGVLNAGDSIAIEDDGHPWGKDEREAPYWLIAKCPSLTTADAVAALDYVPREVNAIGFETVAHRKRVRTMDLTGLPVTARAVIGAQLALGVKEGRYTTPRAVESIDVTLAEWRALVGVRS